MTSPNGTTFAAIELMEQHGVASAVSKAVFRSADRAREMGQQLAEQAIGQGKQV